MNRVIMNGAEEEMEIAELPLPQSQRELELLLEALHALNDTIDEESPEPATTLR